MKYKEKQFVSHPALPAPVEIIKVIDDNTVILRGVPGTTSTADLTLAQPAPQVEAKKEK